MNDVHICVLMYVFYNVVLYTCHVHRDNNQSERTDGNNITDLRECLEGPVNIRKPTGGLVPESHVTDSRIMANPSRIKVIILITRNMLENKLNLLTETL